MDIPLNTNTNTLWTNLFTPSLRRIGAGHCGSVWACPYNTLPTNLAIKREDGSPGRSLQNEFTIHSHLTNTAITTPPLSTTAEINIPSCYNLLTNTSPSWPTLLTNFPPGYTPCKALLTERIPPMPREVRELLINLYCPSQLREEIAADPRNEDCIIRIYLGRRRRRERCSMFKAFSLRNFILHADQMEELGLDLGLYACLMGEAVAWMHWRAGVDGNDVEFVLAPSRAANLNNNSSSSNTPFRIAENETIITINAQENPTLGTGPPIHHPNLTSHALWILDFDCCHPLPWTQPGLQKAVKAFLRNDPYFPRPGSLVVADQENWEIFRKRYLMVSEGLLEKEKGEVRELPRGFIEGVVRDVGVFRGSASGR